MNALHQLDGLWTLGLGRCIKEVLCYLSSLQSRVIDLLRAVR